VQQIEWISSWIQREIRPKRNLAFSTERCKSAENRGRCENFSKPESEVSFRTRQISCQRNHGRLASKNLDAIKCRSSPSRRNFCQMKHSERKIRYNFAHKQKR